MIMANSTLIQFPISRMIKRWGIYADPHANLPALKAGLKKMDELGVEAKVCLGDTVGYGFWPNECIALQREHQVATIAGNHDLALLTGIDPEKSSPRANFVLDWTRRNITQESLQYLRVLYYSLFNLPFDNVHSRLESPFKGTFRQNGFYATFRNMRSNLCFVGHGHRPYLAQKLEGSQNIDPAKVSTTEDRLGAKVDSPIGFSSTFSLDPHEVYVVNPGAIGIPNRIEIAAATFIIYDIEAQTIVFHAAEYNIEEVYAKIRATVECPPDIQEALIHGFTPNTVTVQLA